jgi:hypothetical protein
MVADKCKQFHMFDQERAINNSEEPVVSASDILTIGGNKIHSTLRAFHKRRCRFAEEEKGEDNEAELNAQLNMTIDFTSTGTLMSF